MSIDKLYDDIDVIVQSMYDYHGFGKDDRYSDCAEDEETDFFDTNCTREDIESAGNILEVFTDNLIAISNDEQHSSDIIDESILSIVENAVKRLNKLNEKCDCELIESTISDDICDYIQNAAILAGLTDIPDSVADEWREF